MKGVSGQELETHRGSQAEVGRVQREGSRGSAVLEAAGPGWEVTVGQIDGIRLRAVAAFRVLVFHCDR